MIPHRPKRQDVVLTCQGNDQHNVLLVADLAAKQVINRPPVITGGQAHVIKISEHTPGFSLIATIAATDPDGDRDEQDGGVSPRPNPSLHHRRRQ